MCSIVAELTVEKGPTILAIVPRGPLNPGSGTQETRKSSQISPFSPALPLLSGRPAQGSPGMASPGSP